MSTQVCRILTRLLALVMGAVPLVALATYPVDPTIVPKWQDPLPLAGWSFMPQASRPAGVPINADYYEIAARPFNQQVLPARDINLNPLPPTAVFGFGPNLATTPVCDAAGPTSACFHYPSLVTRSVSGTPVEVLWLNQLKDNGGNWVPYPPSVRFDGGFHWANPGGRCDDLGRPGTDCTGPSGQYTGPVPISVHVHGSERVPSESDGIPEAWFLPANTPGYVGFGSDYCHSDVTGTVRDCSHTPGQARFYYPNTQAPTTLFYHDHTLGVTLENIAMGLVGPWLVTAAPGSPYDVPSLPAFPNYDVPLVIQDKGFVSDGNLTYFTSADSGKIGVVNGKVWPYLNVQPRKYRLRLVHGGPATYYQYHFNNGLRFTLIGSDQGFLPTPVVVSSIKAAPGERYEAVVDFSGLAGRTVTLQTDSLDLLQIRVNLPLAGTDTAFVPTTLPVDPFNNKTASDANASVQKVALFGTLLGADTTHPLLWDAPTTEFPARGTVQEWDLVNVGGDSHPMHLHEVSFKVLGRTRLDGVTCVGPCGPRAGETGLKDTVIADGNQITKVLVNFNTVHYGLFAWHCHITPHEDDEMMRPMCIIPDKNSMPANPSLDGFAGCPAEPTH